MREKSDGLGNFNTSIGGNYGDGRKNTGKLNDRISEVSRK